MVTGGWRVLKFPALAAEGISGPILLLSFIASLTILPTLSCMPTLLSAICLRRLAWLLIRLPALVLTTLVQILLLVVVPSAILSVLSLSSSTASLYTTNYCSKGRLAARVD